MALFDMPESETNPTLSAIVLSLRRSQTCLAAITKRDVIRAAKTAQVTIKDGRVPRASVPTLFFTLIAEKRGA